MFNSFGFDNSMQMMHQQAIEQQQMMHQQAMDQHLMMQQQFDEQQFMDQQRLFAEQQRRYMEDWQRDDIPRRRYAKKQSDPLYIDEVSVPSRGQTTAVQSRGLFSEMWHYLKRLCK